MYNASIDTKRVCALPQRRLTWQYEEVMYFINILKQKKQQGLFDRGRLRVTDFYHNVEETMNMAGFKKTAIQLSIKFKNLKAEYFRCKRNNTDIISEGKVFPYFKAMDELLSTEREHFETPVIEWSYSSNSSGTNFKTEPVDIESMNEDYEYEEYEEPDYFIYEATVQDGVYGSVETKKNDSTTSFTEASS